MNFSMSGARARVRVGDLETIGFGPCRLNGTRRDGRDFPM